MKSYVLLSEKKWHDSLFQKLSGTVNGKWHRIKEKKDFNLTNLSVLQPDIIFIPHWSYIIPESIFEKYECIVFHMTDLPYGRGGSPLQNLILEGNTKTKISAIRVTKGIDEGPIYCKEDIDLSGTARDIFLRMIPVIESMIVKIVTSEIIPQVQKGKVINFKRRTPADSRIDNINSIDKLYDVIRMLDCEGYPAAFLENEHFRFEFTATSKIDKHSLLADVRIIKK
jgi:methionyl-tRNA formyltransferase